MLVRARRAVFDLIPGHSAASGHRAGQRASYREFLLAHSRGGRRRRGRTRIKGLFLQWLKQEREKDKMKETDETV